MTKLHLVPAAPDETPPLKAAVRARRRADPNPGFAIQCPRCGGREITQTVLGATLKGGKVIGGTKAWVCACCLLNGQRVALA